MTRSTSQPEFLRLLFLLRLFFVAFEILAFLTSIPWKLNEEGSPIAAFHEFGARPDGQIRIK
ncbi:hypothetical protein [Pedobacter sp. FW305-3-2-15-E-R2A2]|uniref:hypothetical protein n=1 Tax=Pedobacter sp. FW305-3-2-15-E-R2A2 TaxID=3140251 RepID=UPI0031405C8E